MVVAPQNACKVCGSQHWIRVYPHGVDNTKLEDIRKEPCPECNPYGTKLEVRY